MIIKVLFGENELIILCAIIATLKYEQVSEILIDNFYLIIDKIMRMSMSICENYEYNGLI